MGFIVLDRVIPDASYPDVRADAMLPAQGALWYVDPMHPANPWPTGLPSSTPNLVWEQAAALIPDSTEQTLAPRLTFNSQFLNDGKRNLAERTTAGGLHIAESLATLTSESQARITLPTSLRTYLIANKDHELFFASWGRITRGRTGSAQRRTWIGLTSGTMASFYVRASGTGETALPADTRRTGTYSEGAVAPLETTDQLRYQDISSIDPTTTGVRGFLVDSTRLAKDSVNTAISDIIYGLYSEDLTVSGRTYAQAHAAVFERYTSTVKTPGGRYYGDAWTDPTTVHD